MANYSYTVQRDYVFDNIKTQRAYQSLKSLPFVDTTIQSSLYKLLNAPNIELDRLRDSIRDSSLSVNPAIANFSLPASLYLTQVSIENYSEEGLHKKEQLHFGAPTSFSSGTESTFDLEYDILDIHYLSPAFYLDSAYNIIELKEAYAILTNSSEGWFGQQVKLVSTDFLTEYNSSNLPSFYQNRDSAEDEWISLDNSNSYTLTNENIDAGSIVLINALASTADSTEIIPATIVDPNNSAAILDVYTISGNTITIQHSDYLEKQMVIEYNYAPVSSLKSITYSEDFYSVLKNSRNVRDFLYLVSEETSRNLNYVINNGRLLFKQQEIQIGGSCEGTVLISKEKINEGTEASLFTGLGEGITGITIEMPSDWLSGSITSLIIGDTETVGNDSWIIDEGSSVPFLVKVFKNGTAPIALNDGTEINIGDYVDVRAVYTKTVEVNATVGNNVVQDTDIVYTTEGLSFNYSELLLDEILEEISNFLFISADLTVITTPHHSLIYYPYSTHFEENDFGNGFVSLNHSSAGSYLEKYSLSGNIQYRIPVDLDTVAIKRFQTEIALLVDSPGNFHIDYYKVDDLSFARTVELEETAVPSTYSNICLTLLKDHTFELVFLETDSATQFTKVKHTPAYDYKAFAPSFELTQYGYETDPTLAYYYYRQYPASSSYYDSNVETILDSSKAIVEHSLDQWGRILGNDRWDDESLLTFSNRLTNIAIAKGNTNLQKALEGISATFAVPSYNSIKNNVYSLTNSIARVKETISSEVVNGTNHYFNFPTLVAASAVDKGVVGVSMSGVDIKSDFLSNIALLDIKGTSISLDYTRISINPIALGLGDPTTGLLTSFDIIVEYKPLTSYTYNSTTAVVGESTNSTKISDQPFSNVGLIEFTDNELPPHKAEVVIKYYTKASISDFFLSSTSFARKYYYTEETISILNEELYNPGTNIKLVSLLEETTTINAIPDPYKEALTEATKDFNFKWGDGSVSSEAYAFSWDDYRWSDGENIQTGIPTLYFDSGMTSVSNTDFLAGTSNKSLSLTKNKLNHNKKIELHTGVFYYDNRECFLYPEATTWQQGISYDVSGTVLTDIPAGNSPSTLRDNSYGTWTLNSTGSVFNTTGLTVRELIDSSLMVEQYPYINSQAAFVRPMVNFPSTVNINDISNLLTNPMDISENHYYIKDQASDFPKIYPSYSNSPNTFTLIYGTGHSHKMEVPIEFKPSLDIDKKILCIGDTNHGIDEASITILANSTLFSTEDSSITLFVFIKDIEKCYMKNISIVASSTIDNIFSPTLALTNETGLAIIEIDISNIQTDFTVTITATQEGASSPKTADITLNKLD
jgi:hypothetical protein